MTKPFFSVLIPAYNAQDFLVQCVDSVLAQICQNFEIILVDDGSSDRTGLICDDLSAKDCRIKVIHQPNQGPLASRIQAVKQASGDYCLFLDADDFWDDNLLFLVEQAISEFHPDLVLFNFKKVSADLQTLSIQKPIFKDKTLFTQSNKSDLIKIVASKTIFNPLWSKAIHRSLLDTIDFEPYLTIRNGEDLLQSIPPLFESKCVVYLAEPLYNYRIVANSLSHSFRPNYYQESSIVRGVLLDYIKKYKLDNLQIMRGFYQKYLSVLVEFFFTVQNAELDVTTRKSIQRRIQTDLLFFKACDESKSLIISKKNRLGAILIKHRLNLLYTPFSWLYQWMGKNGL